MPEPALPNIEPQPQHFELTVCPATPLRSWAALLVDADGRHLEFTSPIELLRHLAQLGHTSPPAGHLR